MEKLYFSNSITTAATTSSSSSTTTATTGTIGLCTDPSQSTIGLLTTVAALPLKYKIRYLVPETPLDLSVCKQNVMIDSSITPPCTPSPIKKRILEIESINTRTLKSINLMKKYDEIKPENLSENESRNNERDVIDVDHTHLENGKKLFKSKSIDFNFHNPKEQKTPNNKKIILKKSNPANSPIKSITTVKSQQNESSNSKFTIKERKLKAIRKLKFDDDKSSPVSGTIIRSLNDIINNITDRTAVVAGGGNTNINNNNINSNAIESGDIDPEYNIVEVTEEAKAELALIPNVIGSYTCKLCRQEFEDAFCLARHRCSCIILLEYRCPECGKRFNCPANLASHRRWHKPKNELLIQKQKALNTNNSAQIKSKNKPSQSTNNTNSNDHQLFTCTECNKSFKRKAYLRKHLQSHTNLNKENTNDNNKNLNCIKSEIQNGVNNNIIPYNMDGEDDVEDFIENDNSTYDDVKSNDSNSNNNGHHEYIKYQYNNNNNNNFQSISPSISTTSSISTSSVMSDTSPSHPKYRIYENSFTEAENIAASALAHLRNGPSVIRHTTTLSV